MKIKNFNKSAGQASRILIILAVVVLVAIVVVYWVTRIVVTKKSQGSQPTSSAIQTRMFGDLMRTM